VLFSSLLKLARTTSLNGRPAIEDALVRDDLARLHCMVAAHAAEDRAQLHRAFRGEKAAPAGGAFAKLYNSQIATQIALAAQKIIGEQALGSVVENAPGPTRWVKQFFNSIAAQIGGGTSNMQRNMIAERALGMPRD
jgi:alkylation response protein AidB-like acyl-CoA dehydrogenase